MSPRPDVSEERKDQILDAASEVFVEKGVHAARMDDVAQKSGLSKGTLYWYFNSKDDIIIDIFERMFVREFRQLEKIRDASGTASEKIMAFTQYALADLNKMLRLMPLAYEFLSLAFRSKFVQEAFKRYVNHYMDILVPIIQDGIDQGEFRPVDATEVAIATGALFEGTILLWVYDHSLVDVDKHILSGIHFLLAGIQAGTQPFTPK
jgi:TetR/AcrR family fatty acid metabolism transcriptional regulator